MFQEVRSTLALIITFDRVRGRFCWNKNYVFVVLCNRVTFQFSSFKKLLPLFLILCHFTMAVVLCRFFLIDCIDNLTFIPFSIVELASNNSANGFLLVCLGMSDGTSWMG